jgi:hypothetical protein
MALGGLGATQAWAALAAPVLISPAHLAVDVSTSPRLSWHPVNDATGYWIQVSLNDGFTHLIVNRGQEATAAELSGLLKNTHYWWRVHAYREDLEGPWSEVRRFTTASGEELDAPVLVSPENHASRQPRSLLLTWREVPGAAGYWLQVSRNETFTRLVVNRDGLTKTSAEVSHLLAGVRYFWRVKAYHGTVQSAWSTVWVFTTACELARPVLLHPPNGLTGASTALVFEWKPVAGATRYWLQVSANSAFTELLVDHDGLREPRAEVNELPAGKQLWWRVKAINTVGHGPWSQVWTLTTGGEH